MLISAYCKLPLVKYFDSCITNTTIEKTLVVRYRPEDIAAGASDLDLYPYCKGNGWKMYIYTCLKIVAFYKKDNKNCRFLEKRQ
jgi:hypothetical protein